MPRIRCRYMDCVFLEENFCGAAAIELDPDAGCLTYSQTEKASTEPEADWEEDEFDDEWEDEDEDGFEVEEEDDLDEEDEN